MYCFFWHLNNLPNIIIHYRQTYMYTSMDCANISYTCFINYTYMVCLGLKKKYRLLRLRYVPVWYATCLFLLLTKFQISEV